MTVEFFQICHCCLCLYQMDPKLGHFMFFLRTFCHFISLQSKKHYFDTWLFIPNSMSDKNLGLKLFRKMLFLAIFWQKGPRRCILYFVLIFFFCFSWKYSQNYCDTTIIIIQNYCCLRIILLLLLIIIIVITIIIMILNFLFQISCLEKF